MTLEGRIHAWVLMGEATSLLQSEMAELATERDALVALVDEIRDFVRGHGGVGEYSPECLSCRIARMLAEYDEAAS